MVIVVWYESKRADVLYLCLSIFIVPGDKRMICFFYHGGMTERALRNVNLTSVRCRNDSFLYRIDVRILRGWNNAHALSSWLLLRAIIICK